MSSVVCCKVQVTGASIVSLHNFDYICKVTYLTILCIEL